MRPLTVCTAGLELLRIALVPAALLLVATLLAPPAGAQMPDAPASALPPGAGTVPAPAAVAASAPGAATVPGANAAPAPGAVAATPRYRPARFAGRAGAYYRHVWGVEQLMVREAESGELLRFSWRVVDAERAGILNDKKVEPSLIAPQRGVSLVVPVLDKIGQMRQTMPPESGHGYWMAFSNKGHLIRRGDRVDVVVGNFRAEGLVVD